jgi:hypothetical protein
MMMKKYSIEIKWAALFSVMSLVWMFIEKSVGLHDVYIDKHVYYTNLIAIPAILIYVFALLEKKKKFYNGIMNFGQAFVSGTIISVIVAVLSPLVQTITSLGITPDYFKNAIQHTVDTKLMSQADAEAFFNLNNYIIQGLYGAVIMGIITTAIVGFFVKTKSVNH